VPETVAPSLLPVLLETLELVHVPIVLPPDVSRVEVPATNSALTSVPAAYTVVQALSVQSLVAEAVPALNPIRAVTAMTARPNLCKFFMATSLLGLGHGRSASYCLTDQPLNQEILIA
jgi:hypothetical protein